MYCIKCSDMIVCVFVQHEQSCEQLCAALSSEASAIQKLQAAEESKARLLAAAEESQASMTQQLQAAEDSAASAKQQLDESLKSNIAATKRAESCALTARFVAEAANEAAKQLNDEVEELRNAVLRLHDRVRVADEHAAAANRQLELKIVSNRSQGGALKQLQTALAEAEAARRTAEESARLAQDNLAVYERVSRSQGAALKELRTALAEMEAARRTAEESARLAQETIAVYERQLAEAKASGNAAAEAAIQVAKTASALVEKETELRELHEQHGQLKREVAITQQQLGLSDANTEAARIEARAYQAQLAEAQKKAAAEKAEFLDKEEFLDLTAAATAKELRQLQVEHKRQGEDLVAVQDMLRMSEANTAAARAEASTYHAQLADVMREAAATQDTFGELSPEGSQKLTDLLCNIEAAEVAEEEAALPDETPRSEAARILLTLHPVVGITIAKVASGVSAETPQIRGGPYLQYLSKSGVMHPASTRGRSGTFFGTYSPDQVPLQVGALKGLAILHVSPGSAADDAGLREGEYVKKVDGSWHTRARAREYARTLRMLPKTKRPTNPQSYFLGLCGYGTYIDGLYRYVPYGPTLRTPTRIIMAYRAMAYTVMTYIGMAI